jgi:alkylation response protein AidB-like acyl-CoA dehydrogenase
MTTAAAAETVATPFSLVRALRPLIVEHRQWAEAHARIAPAVLESARLAGVFTLCAPREVGGADAPFTALMEIFEELGYADATVAWHAANSVVVATVLANIPDDQRARICADPPGPYGFSATPAGVAIPVAGGYRLSGRWPFVTGVLDAPWSSLLGVVHEGDQPRLIDGIPDVRRFLVPASDITVERTWEASVAMRGTGSHAVSAQDAFVPESLAVVAPARETPQHLRSHAVRLPRGAVTPVTNAAIGVGLVRRALDEALRVTREKPLAGTAVGLRELPGRQRLIGNAAAAVPGLKAALLSVAEEVDGSLGERPTDVPEEVRARMWGTMFWVLDHCRALMSELVTLMTSSYFSSANECESAARDLNAICASMEIVRGNVEAGGRVHLGLAPDAPGF